MFRRAGRNPDAFGSGLSAERAVGRIARASAQRAQRLRQVHGNLRLDDNLAGLGREGARQGARTRGGERANRHARFGTQRSRGIGQARRGQRVRVSARRRGQRPGGRGGLRAHSTSLRGRVLGFEPTESGDGASRTHTLP